MNWFTFFSSKVNCSSPILKVPTDFQPIVENTSTLSPTVNAGVMFFVNSVFNDVLNVPFTVDSSSIISYRSSPSYLPLYFTLSTTAEAYWPSISWTIVFPIRSSGVPVVIFALSAYTWIQSDSELFRVWSLGYETSGFGSSLIKHLNKNLMELSVPFAL